MDDTAQEDLLHTKSPHQVPVVCYAELLATARRGRFDDIVAVLVPRFDSQCSPHMLDAIMMITWRIWYVHNEITHHKPQPPVEISKRFILSYVSTLHQLKVSTTAEIVKGKKPMIPDVCIPETPTSVVNKRCSVWQAPSPGWVKLNYDGSFKESDKSAGAGMILRDERGNILLSSCKQLFKCLDPLDAEARACLEGLRLAIDSNPLPIEMELDCSNLIHAIQTKEPDRSVLAHTISDIQNLVFGSRIISIVKVDRSVNRVIHCVANIARAEGRIMVWRGSEPECILQAVNLD